MRYGRFAGFIGWLCGLAMGAILIYIAGLHGSPVSQPVSAEAPPWVFITLYAVGGALLVINIIWVLVRLLSSGTQTYVSFDNENGQIRVSVSAVEETLTRAAQGIEDVQMVRVRIKSDKASRTPRAITIWAWFVETADQTAAQQRLQEVVRTRFAEVLQADEEIKIDVNVERFVPERKAESRRERKAKARSKDVQPPEETNESSYHGPRYPVGE